MKKYLKVLSALVLVTGLSSCLKDEPIIGSKPSNIVEFYSTSAISSTTTQPYPIYIQSFDVKPDGNFDVILSYSGTETAPQDINIEIALAPDAVDKTNVPIKKKAYDDAYADAYKEAYDYDIEDGYTEEEAIADATEYATGEAQDASDAAGYVMMPTDLYSLSTMSVTIKKGERRSNPITVSVKPDQFDFTLKYAVPLTIKSSSFGNVSGNFSTVIYNIGAKNAYDGVYGFSTTDYESLNPSVSVDDNDEAELITVDANTVRGYLANMYLNQFNYRIDPTTNKVTVTVTGVGGTAVTDPSSNWNPDTKTLYVKWVVGSYKFEETYVFKNPRP